MINWKKSKEYMRFKDNIWAAYLTDMEWLFSTKKC